MEELFLWLFIWRVLNPLADYVQSLVLSLPAPSIQIIPSISVSSVVSLIVAILFVVIIFAAIDKYQQSRKEVSLKTEEIAKPSTAQKRLNWLSKFRIFPIRKEKRADLWMAFAAMMIIGIMAIVIAFSFLSTSIPSNATFVFLIINTTMIGAGILMIALSASFMITELHAMCETRKQHITNRKTAYLNALKTFNRSFEALQEASQPKTKEIRLSDFENCLRDLCNNFPWDNEVGSRIADVVRYIPLMLSDDPYADHYVFYLKMIINGHGKHTIPMIKEKFLTEFEKMYDDPKFETDHQIISILMELHEYSEEYMMRVVDDAASRWSDSRFQALASDVEMGFSEMSRRNQEAYGEFFNRLDGKMQVAERNNEGKAFGRFMTLRKSAVRYTVT